MARKTDRPSTIDRLPTQIQEEIGRLRRRGRTLDEILEHIRTLDPESTATISRSALGRHIKSQAQVLEDMKLTDNLSLAIAERHSDKPADQIALANMALLQSVIMKIVTADRTDENGEPLTLDAKEVHHLTSSLRDLVLSRKTDLDRELKIKQEMAKEAARAVETFGAEAGLSAATVDAIKNRVLGIAK